MFFNDEKSMELKGKTAIVTGISKGIGKAISLQLLEKGCEVIGWGRNKPDYDHPKLSFITTNMRDFDSVSQSFKHSMDISAEIHLLVNNAGLGYFGPIEEMDLEEWHCMMETNVNGIFYALKNVIPVMKKQEKGHVINISSVAGLMANPLISGYSASKFAVKGMTESLFKELRDFGIKVTGVYPGSVNTAFFDNAPGMDAHDQMLHAGEVATQIIKAIETSDNFLINHLEFRPLQPKPKK